MTFVLRLALVLGGLGFASVFVVALLVGGIYLIATGHPTGGYALVDGAALWECMGSARVWPQWLGLSGGVALRRLRRIGRVGAWRWGGFSGEVVSWLGDATACMPWDGTRDGAAKF